MSHFRKLLADLTGLSISPPPEVCVGHDPAPRRVATGRGVVLWFDQCRGHGQIRRADGGGAVIVHDVSFRFMDGGLVRIELTQVEKLTSHYSNDPNEASCKLVGRRLEDKFGTAQSSGAEKRWSFASGNIRSGKWQTGYVYVIFARDQNPRAEGASDFVLVHGE
jgi:hypothetical protein